MAELHIERGHVRLGNALYVAIVEARFSDLQRRIVLTLIRLTDGWGRETVEISTPELARQLDHEPAGRFRAQLSDLITAGVIVQVVRGDGKVRSVYRVEKDYERWGKYALASAMLAAKWGVRPQHRDAIMAVSSDGDGSTDGQAGTEGDSSESPSSFAEGAPNRGRVGASDRGREGAPNRGRGGAPQGGTGGASVRGTPTGSKSSETEGYGAGKTLKDRKDNRTTTPPAREELLFDVTAVKRWAELEALCETDVEKAGMRSFLERQTSADEARRWIPRLINWLAGEMVPPAWKGKLTVPILATALDEYSGTFAVRHVQAYVEDVMRRFAGERSGRPAVTPDVESALDKWAAGDAAQEKRSA